MWLKIASGAMVQRHSCKEYNKYRRVDYVQKFKKKKILSYYCNKRAKCTHFPELCRLKCPYFMNLKCPDRLWGTPSLMSSCYLGSFLGLKWLGCEVDYSPTHLHLVPRLRVSGAIPLCHLYTYMARTGKILPFFIS